MPTVETNGTETYYEEYGEGSPLVVLHGATADHKVWAEQLQPLADEHRVIVYDLRGHGKTSAAPRETYTVAHYVDDLAALIDALELDQPTVLGHSFGGMIGYHFAAKHSDQLSAVVTVGSATPQTFTTGEWVLRIALPKVITPIMDSDRLMSGLVWLQTQLLGDDATGDLDEIERLREAHACAESAPEETDRSNVMRAVQDYMASDFAPGDIEVDLLVMYGEDEPMIEQHAEYLESHVVDCRTMEIPDAGHNSQVDNPEFIRKHLRKFLNAHVPASVSS